MADDDVTITSAHNSATGTQMNAQDGRTGVSICAKCKRQVIAGKSSDEHPFFSKLMEMFPDICPTFLRNLCDGKANTDAVFDELVDELLAGNYERSIQILIRTERQPRPLRSYQNIPLLQEIAYVQHKTEITKYIKQQEEKKVEARRAAKEAALLKTSGCCFEIKKKN